VEKKMLRYVTISAAVICAASTPFVLFPRQTSAWVTPEQLIAVFLFWPVILTSLFLSLHSMLHLSQWKYSSSYIAVFVLALIFPSTLGATTVIRTIGQKTYLAEQFRRNKWFTYGKRLNPLIIDYARRHPDRVSFPFNDDHATIAGLGEYLSARTDMPIKDDKIIDPWGEPVLTIIDHDNDMKLRFDDYFYGVYNSSGNEIALSLFAQSQHSLKPHFNERWQIEGGVIPKGKP
jgi:hypothetical protein